ncbi:efflux RND transporter periplasmic adaptor subunit [Patescibacteria group bacterium]|nr:efflux RND transporter periplasmic adaptor subunit [Patescibacteria group bacterium]
MFNLKKKSIIILSIIGLVVLITGYQFFKKDGVSKYEFVVVEKRDLIQEVSVVGRVRPIQEVNLAFEKSGQVAFIYVKIGDQVTAGQVLITLDDAELKSQLAQAQAGVESARAQLAQAQAVLDNQQAKLQESKRGARPEEVQIATTKVLNAQNSLADAEVNLTNIRNKAEVDLANLYDGVEDILNDAYIKADDAVNRQIDPLYADDTSANPSLTFSVSDAQTKINAENQRVSVGQTLEIFKSKVSNLSNNYSDLDQALENADGYLVNIRNFLIRPSDALNSASSLSQATIDTYKTNVNTARININIALTNVNNQQQSLAAQKIINQNNIAVAQANVNTAQNVLAIANDELTLKKAGATDEQIRSQEAQVKQAESDINSQKAQIKQAQANFENILVQIEKIKLKSPIDGLVIKQEATLGEIVVVNTVVVSLISKDQFEIEVHIPEADIAKLKIGNLAQITLDAYGREQLFEAHIVKIDPAETMIEGVATYKIIMQFTKKDERVKSGMTANIDILTEKREKVIAISQRALINRDGDKLVRILDENDLIKQVIVETGLRGSFGEIEIVSGLKEGDRVIIFLQEE